MNIHGKNNWLVGPFGDHVTGFDFLLPTGESIACSRSHNAGLFRAVIGGFGMLGVMTRIAIRLKYVYSGNLWVEAFTTPDIGGMIDGFEDHAEESDYLVGWLDATCADHGLGRGIVHRASYLAEGEDPDPRSSLSVGAQKLPDHLLGLFPKSLAWWPLSFFVNRPGMRFLNALKVHSARTLGTCGQRYLQSHAAFAFLLDYMPNWKRAYKPGGLIQYQSFLPRDNAGEVFNELLRMSRRAGFPPTLCVFKKHRPDEYLVSHGLDGYSLALDYRVTASNRERVWQLCRQMDDVVLAGQGRFYFAKDATLQPGNVARFLGEDTIGDLARRVFVTEGNAAETITAGN